MGIVAPAKPFILNPKLVGHASPWIDVRESTFFSASLGVGDAGTARVEVMRGVDNHTVFESFPTPIYLTAASPTTYKRDLQGAAYLRFQVETGDGAAYDAIECHLFPFDAEATQHPSKQLGQLRPANMTAASLVANAFNSHLKVDSIWVCNQTGSGVTYRIFHDDDGTTYDETTSLMFDVTLPAKTTHIIEVKIASDDPACNIGVRTNTNNAITFTAYGSVVPR